MSRAMRLRAPRTYAIAGVLLCLLFLALIATSYRLHESQHEIDSNYRSGAWIASQITFEALRTRSAFDRAHFGAGSEDELRLRFDILRSRVPLLVSGAEAEHLLRIPRIRDRVSELEALLARSDAILRQHRPGDDRGWRELGTILDTLVEKSHGIYLEAFGRASTQEGKTYLGWSFVLVLAALSIAFVCSIVLAAIGILQARRAQQTTIRLLATASRLAETSAQLDEIVGNAPFAIALKDMHGRFVLANPVLRTWFGIGNGDLGGRTADQLLPAPAAACCNELDRQVREANATVSTEVPVVMNGGDRFLSVTAFPIVDRLGGLEGIGFVAADVTDQHLAEKKLQAAHRMEAAGQLAGGMAHDFNNLLMIVRGNLELIELHAADNPDVLKRTARSMAAIDRSAELVRRLLAYTRRQSLQPATVAIRDLYDRIDGLMLRTLPENIDVRVDIAEDVPPVHADPTQIETALINLIVNARHAMPEGGTLALGARRAADPAGADRDLVALSVTDTGHGIPAEILDRVTEPFFTTRGVGEGSGLGLSMVHGFAGQSGGDFRIASTPNRETTATLYLPAAHTEDAPAVTPVGALPGSETILVVEDDPDVRVLLSTMLEALDYTVLTVEHAAPALALLQTRDDIAVLISDIVLPGGTSGRSLLETASRLHPAVRRIAISGYPDSIITREGALPTGTHLLRKPFDLSAAGVAVAEALADAAYAQAS